MPINIAGGNPTGLGYTLGNIDLATQQADLERKRQMLQALMLQSLAPGGGTQMAGPIAIRNPKIAPLAQMLQTYMAQTGMNSLSTSERELIQKKQADAEQALQDLMTKSQPQAGTPTVYTEQPGPPDEQGRPSMTVDQGTPGGYDTPGFAKAYTAATLAGADPSVLNEFRNEFRANQMLSRTGNPMLMRMAGVPQAEPSFTPGDATRGASLSVPAGIQPTAGGTFGGGTGGAAPGAAGAGQQTSSFGGVPDDAAQMMIMSGMNPLLAGYGKLGTAIAEAAKPIPGRAGAPLYGKDAQGRTVVIGFTPSLEKGQTLDAQGNVTTAPGYLASAGQIQTQDEAIKAGFKPVVMESDGIKQQGYIGVGGVFTPYRQAGAAPTPEAFARQQDAAGKSIDVVVPPAAGGGGAGFNRSLSPGAEQFQKDEGAAVSKQFAGFRDAGDQAAIGRATNAQMIDALDGFTPGASAPLRQKLAERLQALPWAGLTADSPIVKMTAGGDINAMQEFGKLAYGNAASQLRSTLPGQRLTQMEILQNYLNSPNPSLQRASIQTMLEMQDGIYRWSQDRVDAMDKWTGDPRSFGNWWNRTHSLTGNDATGQPYIPTLSQVKERLAAAGKGPAEVPGARPGEIPQPPVRITGDADYAKLKSGTVFVGPDGVPRTKP
jgi:hypothetical protein